MYTFLIHYLVLQCMHMIITNLVFKNVSSVIVCVIAMTVTAVMTCMFIKVKNRVVIVSKSCCYLWLENQNDRFFSNIGGRYTMIYALNFKTVYFLILIGIGSWVFLWRWLKGQERFWGLLNVFLCLIALYFVLKYTVLHRISSNNHQFMIFAPRNSEFYREMLMNAFLFYPFGLTLTVLIGPWSILVAFVLSFGISSR